MELENVLDHLALDRDPQFCSPIFQVAQSFLESFPISQTVLVWVSVARAMPPAEQVVAMMD
jgi:hypothetical protein